MREAGSWKYCGMNIVPQAIKGTEMNVFHGKLNPTPLFSRDKKSSQYYKGIKAMSDTNLHEQLLFLLKEGIVLKGSSKKALTILDLGCGEGAFSQMLFDAGYNVIAVDVKKDGFKAAGPEFVALDLNDNERKERFTAVYKGKFDVIFAVEIVEHLKNPWDFIFFLKSISNEGTEVLITTPNIASWWGRLMFLLSGQLWGFDNEAWSNPGHINPISETELSHILFDNGFNLNMVYPCGTMTVIWLFNWKRALVSIMMLPLYLCMKGRKKGWALCFHATCKNK